MVNSMTGFGTGTVTAAGWRVDVTIRTLNHRYLSVRVRAPHDQPRLQVCLEEAVRRAFSRGEVGVWIGLARDREAQQESSLFDRTVIDDHLRELRGIAQELSLPESPTLSDLIQVGAFQVAKPLEADPWSVVEPAVQQAIEATLLARSKEGAQLAEELKEILDQLSGLLAAVKQRLPAVSEELRNRLQEKVASLNIVVDTDRLETEIALLAERFDVREEVTRLSSHLHRAEELLQASSPIGKELEFVSQELLREVNTLGAKSRDLVISSFVVDMKVAIERFKEQVQNVE
jgi:uncharacterized protein (TIGR00255 family)